MPISHALAEMGMATAFSPATADFSGMTGHRDLYISDVLHKVFVAVDQAGTGAAAASVRVAAPNRSAEPLSTVPKTVC